MTMNKVFTIGHSNHTIEKLISLLRAHNVTAVADVRSNPYSRYFPQFSKDALKAALSSEGLAYAFLGKEFGARSENPNCYRQGKVQYELLAKEPLFEKGILRLKAGVQQYNIALVCAEKDPLDCHRAVLVGRRAHESGLVVSHIHADGHLESHEQLEQRMLELLKMSDTDMFRGKCEILEDAYRLRGEQIAYQDEAMLCDEAVVGNAK